MKKYVVLRKIGAYSADEVRGFDNLDDAKAFRDLLAVSEDHKSAMYYVAEIIK